MDMSIEDICRSYREAKNKREQIKILADLNCTSKEEILKVLVDCGEEVPTPAKRKKPTEKPNIPDAVYTAITERMDVLNAVIAETEREYKELAEFIGKKTEE